MSIHIPASLRAEHESIHARLIEATREPGAVGETAREVARLLHPHFVREDNMPRYERFARALLLHAQTEEDVLYPAAIVLGEMVEQRLGGPSLVLGADLEAVG